MKIDHPGPHLDHMLKQTRAHHVQLSSMADLKANMLLTVSSVVITLSASQIMKPHLKWPILVLIAFSLLTIGLAAYAVMPKLPLGRKKKTASDVHNSGFNLLFFGDFVRLDYDEFEGAMEEIMNDPSRTYQAQVRELYTMGLFLAAKKYRYVRLAYFSFLGGLVIAGFVMLTTGMTGQ